MMKTVGYKVEPKKEKKEPKKEPKKASVDVVGSVNDANDLDLKDEDQEDDAE